VTISQPFAVGKLHVTVDQYDAFVRETGYVASSKCYSFEGPKWTSLSWRKLGFEQERSHPVVCLSWDDAKAYVDWLTQKTGKPYRLLSEAEWEYAARSRTSPGAYPRFWFGDDEKDLCRYGNFADQRAGNSVAPCDDGYVWTSPAGHYEPNAFGLYDMFGNAWQWTADCWHDVYEDAPADGSAWTSGACSEHVVRGGSRKEKPELLRAAHRSRGPLGHYSVGFRLARTLTPQS
jgi:formylglycine-generating enzyme required for sulfatase activity